MKAIITTDSGAVVGTAELFDDREFIAAFLQKDLTPAAFLRLKHVYEADGYEVFHEALKIAIDKAAGELQRRPTGVTS